MKTQVVRVFRTAILFAGIACLRTPAIVAADNCSWNGSMSGAWESGDNWTGCTGSGGIPSQADSITVSAGGNQPTISTATANVGSIVLNAGATLTLSGGQALNLGATGGGASNTFTNNGGVFNAASGTVVFTGQGSGDSGSTTTVSGTGTFDFNNITINKSNLTVRFDTDVTVAGTFSQSAGVFQATTCNATTHPATIFSGTTAISGSSTPTFCDLTVSSGTISVSADTRIGNSFTNNGTFSQMTESRTTFNSPASGTLTSALSGSGSTTFGAVTISGDRTINAGSHSFAVIGASWQVSSGGTFNGGTATVTFNPGGGGTTTISGAGNHYFNNVTISSGTVSYSAGTTRVSGNWINNGTFSSGASTVTFNGASAQSIGGTNATTFNNLTINNSSGVSLGQNVTVNGTVALTSGDLNTSANTLTLGSTTTSVTSSGGGDIVGSVKRGSGALTTGSPLAFNHPNVSINFSGGTPSDVTITLNKTAPPTSELACAVARQYTITAHGGSFTSAVLRLRYASAPSCATEANLKLWKKISGRWTSQGGTAYTGDSQKYVELSGVTSFSDWAITDTGSPTAVALSSFTAHSETSSQNDLVIAGLAGALGLSVAGLTYTRRRSRIPGCKKSAN